MSLGPTLIFFVRSTRLFRNVSVNLFFGSQSRRSTPSTFCPGNQDCRRAPFLLRRSHTSAYFIQHDTVPCPHPSTSSSLIQDLTRAVRLVFASSAIRKAHFLRSGEPDVSRLGCCTNHVANHSRPKPVTFTFFLLRIHYVLHLSSFYFPFTPLIFPPLKKKLQPFIRHRPLHAQWSQNSPKSSANSYAGTSTPLYLPVTSGPPPPALA